MGLKQKKSSSIQKSVVGSKNAFDRIWAFRRQYFDKKPDGITPLLYTKVDGHVINSPEWDGNLAEPTCELLTQQLYRYWNQQANTCPYCTGKLISEHVIDPEEFLLVCPNCTWNCAIRESGGPFSGLHFIHLSILRAFDIKNREEALGALASELLLNWERVRDLHPKKMEQFVAAVLKGILDCETRWVGQSHDGGIDVIALIDDHPLAVQVKRRSNHDSVEGVQIVREFCGSLLLSDYQRGMIISTADHFSTVAQKSAQKLLAKSILTSLHLVNCGELYEMFKLIQRDYDTWHECFFGQRTVDK